MSKPRFALLVSFMLATSMLFAATPDVTTPIHQFIDGFNVGDTKSGLAAYAGWFLDSSCSQS